MREYYQKNKEKCRAYRREYYQKNKEKCKLASRLYRQNMSPEQHEKYKMLRRNKYNSLPADRREAMLKKRNEYERNRYREFKRRSGFGEIPVRRYRRAKEKKYIE